MTNPTDTNQASENDLREELREQIFKVIYSATPDMNAITADDSTDNIMEFITAHTNKQIEEVLDRLLYAEKMSEAGQFHMYEDIEAERNKLKEGSDE